MYNFVRRRVFDQAAAEDIVAEAYLLAARSFGKYDPSRAKFSTWVTKIAINCMNSYWRKEHPTAPLDEIPESMASQPSATSEIADRDQVERLLAVLDKTERKLVLMKYRDGYRNIDISEVLGMNASTVSTKLASALAKMRAAAEMSA